MIWLFVRLGIGLVALTAALVIILRTYHLSAHEAGAHLPPGGGPAIVLGHGIEYDGVPSANGVRRTLLAVRLLEEGKAGHLIFSGGPADGRVVGEQMRQLAVAHRAPPARLIVEGQATSTFENLRYSAEIIRERGLGPPIIVTDALHISRAQALAMHLGLPTAGVAVVNSYRGQPFAHLLRGVAREVAAWWHNLGRAAIWSALGALGYADAERDRMLW